VRKRRKRALPLLAALALPPPGTTSRERAFCDAWSALPVTERHAIVERADRTEAGSDAAKLRRRDGVRPRVVDAVTSECRNWRLLMDFEVRAIVDRVQRDGDS
jgi:hypothetical protein